MWNRIITKVKNELPPFNDYLLLQYRREKMDEIVEEVDQVFRESMKLFNDENIKYEGCYELTPEERVARVINSKFKRGIEIRFSSARQLVYKFKFMDNIYYSCTEIPYLHGDAVYFNSTKYYPQFPIVEKGGRSIIGNEIKQKVMRAVLSFWRDVQNPIKMKTVEGTEIYEILIKTRIHQRTRGKKRIKTPLLIYPLSVYGYDKTLELFDFKPGELELVSEVIPDTDYNHLHLGNSAYLKIHKEVLNDLIKRRVIASLYSITKFRKKFSLDELKSSMYYIATLGAYTYPYKKSDMRLLFSNAKSHLENCDTILDLPTRRQLAQIGIHVNNLYEFIIIVFKEIDNWVVSYDPVDLYNKKIGSLNQLLSSFTETVFTKQFQMISNKKGIESNNMSSFANNASKQLGWYVDNQIFKANPTIYNDNWLLSIGAKRFRSLNNIEIRTRDKEAAAKTDKRPPMKMVKSHPSQMVVESIIAIPSNNAVITGTINPYLQIDTNGNIIKPEWADEIKHVFDT